MKPSNVLILPGWQNSGAGHWQTLWEQQHGWHRVEQHDWMRPLRGDWSARLEETVVDADGPVVLVAHSLGCILTAWWAAHSPQAASKVRGALLVAPGTTSGRSRGTYSPEGVAGTCSDRSDTPLSGAGPCTSIGRKITASAISTAAPMRRCFNPDSMGARGSGGPGELYVAARPGF